jgi:hypothetical protein
MFYSRSSKKSCAAPSAACTPDLPESRLCPDRVGTKQRSELSGALKKIFLILNNEKVAFVT